MRSSEKMRRTEASPPPPRLTWRGVGLAAGGWALYTLLYALLVARGQSIPFTWALVGQGIANSVLALYSVPIWWLVVRRMDGVHGGWIITVHLLLGPFYAWIGLESYLGLATLLFGSTVTRQIAAQYLWIFFANLTIYAVQFALYHTVRSMQRLRFKQQQATELKALAREQELTALKAQVNPHFLFNTLNSISATVKRDPDAARAMIADLSELLRYALDRPERELVPLQEEVRFCRAYLALERHRFSDRLRVEYDLDDEVLDAQVPAMTLQPLVENAIKHGIAPSETGGTVTLRVTANGGQVRVQVEDTGVGPDEPVVLDGDPDGVGLSNTDARLQHMLGPEAALHTEANEPHGFRVWFTVPCRSDTENGARRDQKPELPQQTTA